ncbi:MAG: endonuclease/exonuclease/phosphatase family protein [Chloroflexota bacterium]|nr:endonuclease/exonuclease/phosphatase family protein [Chloroflexota bacterium]
MNANQVRIVTYNTAAGNPRITTPQSAFVELSFYREALGGASDAPILALQEVGPAQAKALRVAARTGRCRVLQIRRPGLGNALVVPDRYQVVSSRRRYYLRSQLRGIAVGLRRALHGERPNWRQFGELRMWIEACLRDGASGRTFTVLNTHLSVEPSLKLTQAREIVHRAETAAARRPVILAGDFNAPPASRARGRDVEVAGLLARFRDMGTAVPHRRKNIDYVLAAGFEPVSSRIWSGDSLALPGSPTAETVSDHYAEDDVLAYATEALSA